MESRTGSCKRPEASRKAVLTRGGCVWGGSGEAAATSSPKSQGARAHRRASRSDSPPRIRWGSASCSHLRTRVAVGGQVALRGLGAAMKPSPDTDPHRRLCPGCWAPDTGQPGHKGQERKPSLSPEPGRRGRGTTGRTALLASGAQVGAHVCIWGRRHGPEGWIYARWRSGGGCYRKRPPKQTLICAEALAIDSCGSPLPAVAVPEVGSAGGLQRHEGGSVCSHGAWKARATSLTSRSLPYTGAGDSGNAHKRNLVYDARLLPETKPPSAVITK